MSSKRLDYLCWDDYFMFMAALSAKRSKDPNTQVGACIVSSDQRSLGIGYNGFPKNCSDDDFPWERVADSDFDTKYFYVVHAELNAILNTKKYDLTDCKLYVTLFPCNECAKSIIQKNISEVYYNEIKNEESDSVRASFRMLTAARVKLIKYHAKQKELTLKLF